MYEPVDIMQCRANSRSILSMCADQQLISCESEWVIFIDQMQQHIEIFRNQVRGKISADNDRAVDDHIQISHRKCKMFKIILPDCIQILAYCRKSRLQILHDLQFGSYFSIP